MPGNPLTVTLGGIPDPLADAFAHDALAVVDADVERRLAFAASWGNRLPLPGRGATARRWQLLATAGAIDLSVARTLEPHLDALAIIAEADLADPDPGTTWGVYAAEGPGVRLTARERDGEWHLDGTKPWCSLAGHVTHALVTAWVSDQSRGLFAIDLNASLGVHIDDTTWVSRGLVTITSGPITCTEVRAEPVGRPGWYLRRDGFAWGGIGVAAIWYGAAVALARQLRAAGLRRRPDQVGLAHLGAVDVALTGARSALDQAAAAIDAGELAGTDGALAALRVRGVVAESVESVLRHADHALGPAPLTQDEEYARRVADLRVYVRQHHAERDDAALGSWLQELPDGADPW